MWKRLVFAAALGTASVASAQFAGPSIAGQPSTVAQAREARLGSYVTLTGNVISHLRGDYYTFRDSTGEIRVEIAPNVFAGRRVEPSTNVRILGEVDRGFRGRYVWVKTLDIL